MSLGKIVYDFFVDMHLNRKFLGRVTRNALLFIYTKTYGMGQGR